MTNVAFPFPSLQFFHRNSSIFNLHPSFFILHIFVPLGPHFLPFIMPGILKMAPNEKQGDPRTESELLPMKLTITQLAVKEIPAKSSMVKASCPSFGELLG